AQIHLPDLVEPEAPEDVDEEADLDSVPGEKRQPLEDLPPPGVLAREGLDHAGELGEKEVEQRPRGEFGHPPAPRLGPAPPQLDGAPVEPLDVADPGIAQQRSDEAVDELGMDVPDVGVHPRDEVAAE